VAALRSRQAKNFIAILMISRGVPMLLAGDEIWADPTREQQRLVPKTNELSWFDWGRVEKEQDMLEFALGIIALRRRHASLLHNAFCTGKPIPGRDIPDIAWHGIRLVRTGVARQHDTVHRLYHRWSRSNRRRPSCDSQHGQRRTKRTDPTHPGQKNWYPVVDTSDHSDFRHFLTRNHARFYDDVASAATLGGNFLKPASPEISHANASTRLLRASGNIGEDKHNQRLAGLPALEKCCPKEEEILKSPSRYDDTAQPIS